MLLRLGWARALAGSICQIPRASCDGCVDPCGEALDDSLTHPLLCKAGAARLRPHRGLASCLAGKIRRAGGHADVERACPQLYEEDEHGVLREAILDVVYHTPGGLIQRMIDVTVRCPHARRYTNAASIAAVAACAGENDKRDRYGESVLTVAFESYGRLGYGGIQNLYTVAGDLGLFTNGRRSFGWFYNQLRFALERALYYELSDIVMLALGSTAGFSNWRARVSANDARRNG